MLSSVTVFGHCAQVESRTLYSTFFKEMLIKAAYYHYVCSLLYLEFQEAVLAPVVLAMLNNIAVKLRIISWMLNSHVVI